jgi:hypothetical protein
MYYRLYLCVCVCVCARAGVGAWASARACVRVGLLIQHATRMRHVVTSFVAPLAPPYFLLYFTRGTIFE